MSKQPKQSTSATKSAGSRRKGSALSTMGLSPSEERIYLILLRRKADTATALAARAGLPRRAVISALTALETKGAITRALDRTLRFFALPPDVAVEALIARHQRESELVQQNARRMVATLKKFEAVEAVEQGTVENIVEILSCDAAAQAFVQMVRFAKKEILFLERLPALVSPVDAPDNSVLQTLARNVRIRTVTESAVLDLPGSIDRIRTSALAGEQYRIMQKLPFKLVAVDRQVAIIPLNLLRPDGPVLRLRSSSLLDALYEMFEMLWRSGVPFVPTQPAVSREEKLSGTHLLSMIVSGLNDKAIEHQLGISHRTLTRRIGALMRSLGATTRAQLGWIASQRELA